MTTPISLPPRPELDWLLTQFSDEVAGVSHAVAVSADGLLLAHSGGLPPERADQLAAIVAGLVSLTYGAASLLDAGDVAHHIVEMDHGMLFVMSIADGSALAALAPRQCDAGNIGYQLALLADRVGDALTPAARPLPVGR